MRQLRDFFHCSGAFRAVRVFGVVLLALLMCSPDLSGQASALAVPGMSLYINILEGENALDNIRDRTAREPIVQVTDENHQPVKGAAVTFSDVAGTTGAGAAFGGLATYTVVTDENGKAVAHGLKPNSIAGPHTIEVTAVLGMLTAAAVIHQKNVIEIPGGPVGSLGGALASGLGVATGALVAAGTAIGVYVGVVQNSGPVNALNGGTTTTTTPQTVPEIAPEMAYGCLMMLAGAAAVLRGRR